MRELAVAFSGFQGESGRFELPRALAVEFSPLLLTGGDSLTVATYDKRPFQYRWRVSVATRRDTASSAPTFAAVGLRFTAIDDADPRWHRDDVLAATALTERINDIAVGARRRVGTRFDTMAITDPRTCSGKDRLGRDSIPVEDVTSGQQTLRVCRTIPPIALTAEEQAQVDSLNAQLRRNWENRKWNARQLEFAVGTRARTTDERGRGTRAEEHAAWLTFADGVGRWGQLIVGARGGAARDTASGDFRGTGTTGARLYFGNNRQKAFAEAQGTGTQGGRPEWLFNSGLEASVASIAWVNFTAAWSRASGDSRYRFVTHFKIKTSLGNLGS